MQGIAVVTGASSGIGKAIATKLWQQGMYVYCVGRRIQEMPKDCFAVEADLMRLDSLKHLLELLDAEKRVDVLVHSAGVFHTGNGLDNLELQYQVNVKAAYYLTQKLFPLVKNASGQVVFLNSVVGMSVRRPEVTQYAMTKHALRAMADGFRAEANPYGIRVMSVFCGQVATPMQEKAYRESGQDYDPDSLLQAKDVACTISHILNLPPGAEVTDLTIRSTKVP